MTKLKMTSALFSLAMIASPALAQDLVDDKIQELFAQGYTHFEVSRGFLRTEIEAYGPNFTKLEIRLSNADGSIISERTQIESQAEYTENVREISQTNTNIREDLDDDSPDTHSEGATEDFYDNGASDDSYEGIDDDLYENDVDDRDDDHGISGSESRDDSRDDGLDDDHDGDREGDLDDDRDGNRDDDRDDERDNDDDDNDDDDDDDDRDGNRDDDVHDGDDD